MTRFLPYKIPVSNSNVSLLKKNGFFPSGGLGCPPCFALSIPTKLVLHGRLQFVEQATTVSGAVSPGESWTQCSNVCSTKEFLSYERESQSEIPTSELE